MGTPAKKRKLNSDAKTSPVAPRGLDYFFGRKRQSLPTQALPNSDQNGSTSNNPEELTDEELARKLQAEWDQEEAEVRKPQEVPGNLTEVSTVAESLGNAATQDAFDFADVLFKDKPQNRPSEQEGKKTLSLQSAGTAEDTVTSNIPFDESPLTFEPSKYVSELQGHWAAEGGNATYALLTRSFVLVNSTQSRIKIVDTLVNLLRVLIEGDPSSLLPTVCTAILISDCPACL